MQRHFAKAINDMRGLINEWSALSSDAPIFLLAVSGGIDSMCMAELFASLDEPVPFAVAHCNFRLRGADSDADEALVTRWAEEHSVRRHSVSFDTEAYAREKGISIEMAARELRYEWFAKLCADYGYKAVAVAHNANDNAETLILNMLRGSGLRGVTGMSVLSPLPYGESDGLLFRPLLECTRKQIEGYVFAHKVAYRDDCTNASSDYKRNRIRNEVFPIFQTINPSFVRTLNRETAYFADALEIVGSYCRDMEKSVVSRQGQTLRIDIGNLMSTPHWRYLLYHILEPCGFNSAALASLEDLLQSDRTLSGKQFESSEYILFTERDHLRVEPFGRTSPKSCAPAPKSCVPAPSVEEIMTVRGAGVYHFNGAPVKVEVLERTPDMPLKQPEGVLLFDAARLRFPFVLRRWRDGDWLVPFGMKGKKKVSDLFADLKYDSVQKSAAVMVVDVRSEGMAEQKRVAAVAGVRIDDRYKVDAGTKEIIRVTV